MPGPITSHADANTKQIVLLPWSKKILDVSHFRDNMTTVNRAHCSTYYNSRLESSTCNTCFPDMRPSSYEPATAPSAQGHGNIRRTKAPMMVSTSCPRLPKHNEGPRKTVTPKQSGMTTIGINESPSIITEARFIYKHRSTAHRHHNEDFVRTEQNLP